jgi:hypothetical protein
VNGDATPELVETETTDPNDVGLKRTADRTGWLQVMVLAAVALLGAGAAASATVAKVSSIVVTKPDLDAAMRAHSASHDPTIARRMDTFESRLTVDEQKAEDARSEVREGLRQIHEDIRALIRVRGRP